MVDSPNVALLEVYETIRELLARAARDDAMTRHAVGMLLRKADAAGHIYGEHAVECLAKKLGMTTSTLYRYATVADTWSTSDLQTLLARTNRLGEPLSWWHLVTLTIVHSAVERRKVIDLCLSEAWKVRELARHIAVRAATVERAVMETSAEAESVRVALLEGMQGASRARLQMGVFVDALESRWTADVGDTELLARAIREHEKLQQNVEDTLERLRRASREAEASVASAAAVREHGVRGKRDDAVLGVGRPAVKRSVRGRRQRIG